MALVELRADGLAVLRGVRLPLHEGMNALTGETGAGKSVCILALRLALGARVDGDPVRAGLPRATATAVFDGAPDGVRRLLAAHGVPDDDLLTLSREVVRGGRGASRINGALVSQALLREVGSALVEITAQGESHRLLSARRQRQLVDAAGGPAVAEARGAVAAALAGHRAARASLADALAASSAGAAAVEEARLLLADLEPLRLVAGEDGALADECRRLRSAGALAEAVAGLRLAAVGSDELPGGADALAASVAVASGVRGVDARLDEVADEAAELEARLREVGRRAASLAATLELDPARLRWVEERLDVLDAVRRRHGGVEAALAAAARARDLVDSAADDGGVQRLQGDVERAATTLAEAAGRLRRLRQAAASRLERAVSERLRSLRLPHGRLRIIVGAEDDPEGVEVEGRRVACGAEGVDTVEFRLATGADGIPLPLDQGPSGGELSRLALAVRAEVGDAEDSPTLVLDEVDAGIGGATAARVGEVLAEIARTRQVLVVTHRPEIAARARHHLLVAPRQDRAESEVSVVEGAEREHEVARLMSGGATAAALARARELLTEGAESRRAAPRRARTMSTR